MYIGFHPLYNAYKHGYRVFLGKNTNNIAEDLFPFIDNRGKQKFAQIDKNIVEKVFSLSHNCREIFEAIFEQHQTRVDYEAKGSNQYAIKINLLLRETDPRPNKEDLRVLYPNRGNRLNQEKLESDNIYAIFKEELEKNDKGKIVAFDIDEEKILSKDYNLEKVLSDIQESGTSSRIHLRRVSDDQRIGIEIY